MNVFFKTFPACVLHPLLVPLLDPLLDLHLVPLFYLIMSKMTPIFLTGKNWGGGHWGSGQKWPEIGDVIYGWPLFEDLTLS